MSRQEAQFLSDVSSCFDPPTDKTWQRAGQQKVKVLSSPSYVSSLGQQDRGTCLGKISMPTPREDIQSWLLSHQAVLGRQYALNAGEGFKRFDLKPCQQFCQRVGLLIAELVSRLDLQNPCLGEEVILDVIERETLRFNLSPAFNTFLHLKTLLQSTERMNHKDVLRCFSRFLICLRELSQLPSLQLLEFSLDDTESVCLSDVWKEGVLLIRALEDSLCLEEAVVQFLDLYHVVDNYAETIIGKGEFQILPIMMQTDFLGARQQLHLMQSLLIGAGLFTERGELAAVSIFPHRAVDVLYRFKREEPVIRNKIVTISQHLASSIFYSHPMLWPHREAHMFGQADDPQQAADVSDVSSYKQLSVLSQGLSGHAQRVGEVSDQDIKESRTPSPCSSSSSSRTSSQSSSKKRGASQLLLNDSAQCDKRSRSGIRSSPRLSGAGR